MKESWRYAGGVLKPNCECAERKSGGELEFGWKWSGSALKCVGGVLELCWKGMREEASEEKVGERRSAAGTLLLLQYFDINYLIILEKK